MRRKKSLLSPKCTPSGCAQGDSRAIFSEFRKIQRKLPARSPCRKKPVRAFSTVCVRLIGGRRFAFSSFVLTKEEKATKRRKTTRGGISTSSRKPLNLGLSSLPTPLNLALQVFGLRRRRRTSSPRRATARRGSLSPSGAGFAPPFPIGLLPDGDPVPLWTPPFKSDHTGVCEPLCGEPQGTPARTPYGPDTWPARVSNS